MEHREEAVIERLVVAGLNALVAPAAPTGCRPAFLIGGGVGLTGARIEVSQSYAALTTSADTGGAVRDSGFS